MYGYKIKINSLPEIVWACETSVEDYSWKNHNGKDRLELAVLKYKTRTVVLNNCRYDLKNGDFSCVGGDVGYESFSNSGEPVTIVSVAVRFGDFECEFCDITREDCFDESVILIPAVYGSLSVSDEIEFIKLLHNMIKYYNSNSESSRISFLSDFFSLLSRADLLTRQMFSEKTDTNYYVKKVDSIIEQRYGEKITLSQIADELYITPVYLSAVYKEVRGINISDSILRVRMYNAEKKLLNQNIPTAKVALLCGFCDESYFRKKFKKFFGMNVREYRMIKSGITLYHDKPRRNSNG